MYTDSEFEDIYKEFKIIQATRSVKLKKIWGILFLLTALVIVIIIALFPNQFKEEATVWILPTYGGMLLLTTLGGFLISLKYLSEKPFFEYLYKEIYQKININRNKKLEYTSYEKDESRFNKKGGLFTSFATIKIKRHVSGDTNTYNHFNIFDCTMTTSSGKSQQTHFDGIYYVINKQVDTSIQIRTSGFPKLRAVKFDHQKEIDGIKVYKERDQYITNIDRPYIDFMNDLYKTQEFKRVFLSIVNNEVHLALWYKKHPARKMKIVNTDTVNKKLEYFESELSLIDGIINIKNEATL